MNLKEIVVVAGIGLNWPWFESNWRVDLSDTNFTALDDLTRSLLQTWLHDLKIVLTILKSTSERLACTAPHGLQLLVSPTVTRNHRRIERSAEEHPIIKDKFLVCIAVSKGEEEKRSMFT
jgi:hypothetical protein